ncbi:hypothetical protein HMPREF9577_01990 [Cutibacterium acnes HL110PA3]|nr:hypothetical protein HMPREF9619_00659 [Cutibacterium acnes HL082PA2]EFT25128.1 hypothetical protein HMPREF9577_01990 [Cutibacterium acnes HL110PA3]EFT75342.1 hypothetical protein HMPREF9599_00937 [Cutibacterium acnes HL050PA2]
MTKTLAKSQFPFWVREGPTTWGLITPWTSATKTTAGQLS